MAFAFFWIPALHPVAAQTELNAFLRAHRVLAVDREFAANGEASGWSIAVDYAEGAASAPKAGSSGKASVDYRQILEPAAFERFAALRTRRKELAEREGVPAYAVITNEQMAQVARLERAQPPDLKAIQGFGESRIRKYGRELLGALEAPAAAPAADEPSGDVTPDAERSASSGRAGGGEA